MGVQNVNFRTTKNPIDFYFNLPQILQKNVAVSFREVLLTRTSVRIINVGRNR